MQAQTVQERSGTPWIALLMSLVVAAAVVIGVQVAFKGRDVTVTNAPAGPSVLQSQLDREAGLGQVVQGLVDREATVPNQIDQASALQKAGMSQAGIHGIDGTVPGQVWTSHRGRPPLTPAEAQRAQQLIRSSGEPNFLPAMARGIEVHGGRI